jgi:hypothetical protein
MPFSRIRSSFARYTDSELDNKTQSILNAMKGNKNFDNPTPALTELEAALKVYTVALAASMQGGRLKVIQKNAARKALEAMLRTLAAYVTLVGKSDKEILASSNFDLQSEKANASSISAPTGIKVIIRNIRGEVEIKIDPVKGRRVYHYEYTADPLTDNSLWTHEVETNPKHLWKELESGKKYWFRVAAFGMRGAREYSNVVNCFVQ